MLRGPHAFIFFHAASCTVWFARDLFGRRSLNISLAPAAFPDDSRDNMGLVSQSIMVLKAEKKREERESKREDSS
jgi:hypothetical protein